MDISIKLNCTILILFLLQNNAVAILPLRDWSGLEEVKFFHYPTTFDRQEVRLDDVRSIADSSLKEGGPTVILIDGFLSNGSTPMLKTLTDAFLSQGIYPNVIVLDWTSLSGFEPNYESRSMISSAILFFRVLGNVDDVGTRLADFLNFLHVRKDISYSYMHVVGMSLGAHIAGKAGRTVRERYGGKLGRITGLDPATTIIPSRITRVRQGAADFVDIYHTNRGTLGENFEGTGDINVYINGGARQPGCEQLDFSGRGLPGLCSHVYAWRVFDATFRTDFLACPCFGSDCLCKSNCDNRCPNPIQIGISAPFSSRGTFHVNTETLKYN